jgi:hypothetical protein
MGTGTQGTQPVLMRKRMPAVNRNISANYSDEHEIFHIETQLYTQKPWLKVFLQYTNTCIFWKNEIKYFLQC